ncbi:DNA/RNA nuclease SfsA [Clostridium sp. P21]|uniref:Sugar fermentation stimulation protein homolog n=1 Tax=Clostridium muellerianum TaxID=2716538 RepID=A0A7Y0EIJ8_9CLOT|nr:DNA/RNA nuclease SfsA [Clostridium muellerianum]NMM64118.1 DNA/RNA nuclease SfsA [Clostridium muellerianum]
MIINKNIIRSEFIRRPNRFQAYVKINGVETMVHVPNTGRCREILIPGCTVILREETNPNRKTKFDLIAAYKEGTLINIDSQIPNKVVEEALNNKKIKLLNKYNKVQREKTFGNSRFDFKIEDELQNECYVEVKGVTLEENGKTMFPDAPTERGKKHLLELVEVKKSNKEAAVIFLIQMENVKYFTPYDEMDMDFANALRFAHKKGVHVMAYNCKVGENFITLDQSIPVVL